MPETRSELKGLAKEQIERVKAFNRSPPKWAYWVIFIGMAILIKALFIAAR